MIGAVLVYSARGELIVSKLYKSSLKRSIADIFRVQVINNLDVRSPVLTLGSTTFHYIRCSSDSKLWLVTVSRNNDNSAAIWEFLYKFNDALTAYAINSEESLKEEFMLCHELLDIMLLQGDVINETDIHSIAEKMSVKPRETLSSLSTLEHDNQVSLSPVKIPKLLRKASSTISPTSNLEFNWRPNGITHSKNEIILQINERISILVSKDGSILKSHVDGSIDLTTRLTGTPVCQFGLNDSLGDIHGRKNASVGAVHLQDFKFHQCVSLEEFDQNRIIKFVPPDGTIELMKYHVKDNINLPFKVTPVVIQTSRNEMDYRITIKSLFPKKLSARDVLLKIPVPPGTVDCKINVSNGSCSFVPEENAMVWKFTKFNGSTENTMSAVTVPTRDTTPLMLQQWPCPPLSLTFEILMFSNSGLVVRYFTVSERNHKYRVVKWIKYMSKSGSYEIRY